MGANSSQFLIAPQMNPDIRAVVLLSAKGTHALSMQNQEITKAIVYGKI